MKKSIASALTAAIFLSAASTSFAAPTDEEVAALRERVAELERLVREQNDRLAREQNSAITRQRDVDDLDYRVTELERSSGDSWTDKFKITGEMRYRLWSRHKDSDISQLQLRLFPTFQIDEHLAVKSRITGSYILNDDTSSNATMTYAYLEAKYDNFQVNAGKVPLITHADANPNSGSLIADDFFSGVQVLTGDDIKFYVNAGHWSKGIGGDYIGAEAVAKINENLNAGIGYHYAKTGGSDNKSSIIAGGAGYKINDDWGIYGAVAHNNKAGRDKTGYNIEGTWKGAKRDEKGTWGAYAAYRYAPSSVAIAPTYDTFGQDTDKKGFEVGATWTPYYNTFTKLAYFHGKDFDHVNNRVIFARASIFF